MRNLQPFLFRFMEECVSPARVDPDPKYEYDPRWQMVMITEDGKRIPAIDSTDHRGLPTKKSDLEKGEDQKDQLMWR